MKKIKLTGKYANNHYALVDDDFDVLKGKWSLSINGYALKIIDGKVYTMQSWIMKTPKGMETDHINRNKLDNRKHNLQICTQGLNSQRKGLLKTNKSGYFGVQWYKRTNRWRSGIMFNREWVHLGYYKDLNKAILSYNNKAKELFGEMAVLNNLPAR